MKIFLYLSFIALIALLDGCGCNREFEEQNSSTISDINHKKSTTTDKNISSMKALREAIEKELNAKNNSMLKEKNDTTPPIKPTLVSYSNLVEKQLQLTIGREIGAKVFIEDISYGVIGSNRELKIKLDNPHEDYFETFEIVLTDEAGNDSPPLIYTTTFQRAKLGKYYTYYIPQDVSFLNRGFSDREMIITGYPRYKNSAVALIIPFNSFYSNDNKTDILKLNSIVKKIQQNEFVQEFINISEQELEAQRTVIAEYAILTHESISTIELIKSIIYGSYGENLYYLHSKKSDLKDSYFHIKISLLQKYKTYLSIAIVPHRFSLKYQTMINCMINSQNIKRNTTPIYMKEEILKAKMTDKEQEYANFLFVIDDSGSMSNYQKAISQTAKEFALAIKKVGMKFKIGIITTSEKDKAFELLESEGIIENDIKAFQRFLKVGTDGSGVETAIYNIEQALKSKKYGDKEDGILTELEMPKANEKLSIIILSDEPSSYESRAGKEFDIENNLIVNRDYRVYLIGHRKQYSDYYYSYRKEKQPFQHIRNSYGLYGKLAKKTGGLVEDISNIYNYDSIMNSIVQDVLGDLGYKLQQNNVIESTIYVKINDEDIPHSDINGWRYVQTTNSILFSGKYIPNEDDTILVRYSYSLRKE